MMNITDCLYHLEKVQPTYKKTNSSVSKLL